MLAFVARAIENARVFEDRGWHILRLLAGFAARQRATIVAHFGRAGRRNLS
jgi:hypothetical protein